jgi:purine nucleosidase
VALAARKEPRIVERVAEVVLMGGAYGRGNRTPVSEFNIGCDPEAAQIVFREPWPLTMVGLDLTHQALATSEVVARIAALDTAPARFVADLLEFFGGTYRTLQGFPAPPVHDPCAVAFVIDPAVLTTRRAPLDVELHGALTTGMTVADLRGAEPEGCHTRVAVTLHHARFWDLVVDALARLGDP